MEHRTKRFGRIPMILYFYEMDHLYIIIYLKIWWSTKEFFNQFFTKKSKSLKFDI